MSVDSQNRITVHQIWAAGDVGSHVVNPRAAENQAMGGIIDALSQMAQEITVAKGAVEQDELPSTADVADAPDAEDRGLLP